MSSTVVSAKPFSANRARDRKSTRLNSSHGYISYAVFCLKKKNVYPDHSYKHGHDAEENHQLGQHAIPRVHYDHQRLKRLHRSDRLVVVHNANRGADGPFTSAV